MGGRLGPSLRQQAATASRGRPSERGLRELIQLLIEAHRAEEDARQWDEKAGAAGSEDERAAAEERALAARRRAVHHRLLGLLPSCPEAEELAARLQGWLIDIDLGPAALDALAEALDHSNRR